MSVGVISTLPSPTLAQIAELAREAERAGADWLGVPDAFWWRDTWLLAASAVQATSTLAVGPVVTNPYLRHPFHTLAAVGTLQELAGDRVLLGLAAGGSEVGVTAGVDRRDAPARIVELVALLRDVAAGAPLDPVSGRTLEVPLRLPRLLVAGRAPTLLKTGGAIADDVLLWSVPRSELASSAARVAAGGDARILWAPLLVDGDDLDAAVAAPPSEAGYVALNSRPETRRAWGLDEAGVAEIRRGLVAGERVEGLVPEAALRDVLLPLGALAEARTLSRSVGARGIAVAAPSLDAVAPRVAWARAVMAP